MKNISFKYLFLALVLSLGMTACNDFEDENFDFSNSIASYVDIANSAISAEPGEAVAVNFRLREAIQTADVVVGYEMTGDITQSGSVTIVAGDLTGALAITLPTDPDTGTANVKITSVDNGLTIGRSAGGDAVESNIAWEPE